MNKAVRNFIACGCSAALAVSVSLPITSAVAGDSMVSEKSHLALEKDYEELERTYNELEETYDALEAQYASLGTQYNALQGSYDALVAQNAALEARNAALEGDSASQAEYDRAWKEKVVDLEKDLKGVAKERDVLKRQVTKIANERDKLKARFAVAENIAARDDAVASAPQASQVADDPTLAAPALQGVNSPASTVAYRNMDGTAAAVDDARITALESEIDELKASSGDASLLAMRNFTPSRMRAQRIGESGAIIWFKGMSGVAGARYQLMYRVGSGEWARAGACAGFAKLADVGGTGTLQVRVRGGIRTDTGMEWGEWSSAVAAR